MNTPEPRNINQASRLIRTTEKALKLREEGYEFDLRGLDAQTNMGIVYVTKPGDTPTVYIVRRSRLAACSGCNCPDFQKHKDYCKHVLALEDLLQENAEITAYEASCYDGETSNGCDAYAEY